MKINVVFELGAVAITTLATKAQLIIGDLITY